jgi:hypothetical protein
VRFFSLFGDMSALATPLKPDKMTISNLEKKFKAEKLFLYPLLVIITIIIVTLRKSAACMTTINTRGKKKEKEIESTTNINS